MSTTEQCPKCQCEMLDKRVDVIHGDIDLTTNTRIKSPGPWLHFECTRCHHEWKRLRAEMDK